MGQKAALIIATADYQDTGLARLAAPGLDAHDFAGALQSPHIGAFDSVQMLLNEAEPVARRAIARFFSSRKPDDLLLLYFSGHGVRDDHGQLYLAVSDTDRSLLSATAIPANFINEQMNASRSRRLVLILDCCNSGAFAQGSKGALGGSMGIATAFEGTGYGRVVLTATDATQYAWEGDEARGEAANSVFTHFLVQGLETGAADANGDGRITLDELYDYVYEQVVTQTPRQTPRKFAYNQEGDVVIAHNPRPTPRPADLPVELRQALESPLMGVREGAVRELDSLLRGSHRGLALAALEALERLSGDDSRRVSAAAEASLAAHAEAQRQVQAAEAAQAAARDQAAREQAWQRAAEKTALEMAATAQAAEQAEAARQAEQRAADEASRLAAVQAADRQSAEATAERQRSALHAEQERQARQRAAPPEAAQPVTAAPAPSTPPGLPLHAPDPALQARLAQGREEAAWQAEQPQVNARREQVAAAPLLPGLEAAWPRLAPWVFTLLAMIGWGYAREFAYDVASQLYGDGNTALRVQLVGPVFWITSGMLGGLALGLILALTHAAFRGRRTLVTALGWGVASGVGWALTWLLGDLYSTLAGYTIGTFVMGALGGWVLVRALAGRTPAALTQRQALIVAGWVIASFAQYYVKDIVAVHMSEFAAGALAGLIGGGMMFWQLRPLTPAGAAQADAPLFGPGWAVWRQGPAWAGLAPIIYTVLTAVGWGTAGVVADRAYELVYKLIDFEWTAKLASGAGWVTLHTLGTLATVAVLALTRPALRGWRAPLVVAGWFSVSVLAYGLAWLIGENFAWTAGLMLGVFMVGAVGGALLAWALAGVPRTQAGWRWAGLIVAGWVIGGAALLFSDLYFSDAFGPFGNGALVGLIGNLVMFWQLRGK